MATIDLRSVRLRSGEQVQTAYTIDLDPLEIGGQRYVPVPERVDAEVTSSRTTSGLLFELELDVRLVGPCFRCLAETDVRTAVRAREYHALSPDESDELQTPYVVDDRLELSAWAREAVALALPDKILCRGDCAGLCAVCGRDLNREPHVHDDAAPDPRWAALEELRERL